MYRLILNKSVGYHATLPIPRTIQYNGLLFTILLEKLLIVDERGGALYLRADSSGPDTARAIISLPTDREKHCLNKYSSGSREKPQRCKRLTA